MRYNIYLGQIEKAHTKRKLEKLLELIGNDLPPVRTYKLFRAVKTLLFFSCPASAPGGVGS